MIVELDRLSRLASDERRRKLEVFTRHPVAVPALVYEWTPGTADFQVITNLETTRFRDNWPILEAILRNRKAAATHRELLGDWPSAQELPSERQLYQWLSMAVEENKAERLGRGTRNRPYRFRLIPGSGPIEELERVSETPGPSPGAPAEPSPAAELESTVPAMERPSHPGPSGTELV
jgi:hypothetical protein